MTATLAAVAAPSDMDGILSALDGGLEYLDSLQNLEPFTVLGFPVTTATLSVRFFFFFFLHSFSLKLFCIAWQLIGTGVVSLTSALSTVAIPHFGMTNATAPLNSTMA